jgi:hypothetical protein
VSEKKLLKELREKYGERRHLPNPNCHRCKGKGEYWKDIETEFIKPHMSPCACIFFRHEDAELFRGMVAQAAKDVKDGNWK